MINKHTKIVYKKEMKDSFRDKKTFIMQILIPLLIFPLIALFSKISTQDLQPSEKNPVSIAIVGEDTALIDSLESDPAIKIVKSKDPEKDLEKLDVKAIVKIPENFSKDLQAEERPRLEVLYNGSSNKSMVAHSEVLRNIGEYSKKITNNMLIKRDIDPLILEPIDVKDTSIGDDSKSGTGVFLFSFIVPMVLTMWAATGGMSSAIDLGAGEKERQTLEPLLSTQAERSSILLGKYLAVVTNSIISTSATLISFFIASIIGTEFIGDSGGVTIQLVLLSIVLFIGLSLVFSGFELAISFYARNFKEAQTYLSPISMIVMVPSLVTMSLDVMAIPYSYFHIPIVNIVALFKELIYGIYNPLNILTVIVWIAIYLLLSITFTVRMFNSEKVIFRN